MVDFASNSNQVEAEVAIVGAGLAGLIAAQRLHQSGYQVIVLEKSRGLGGRVATRRLPETSADHGLPYLSSLGPLSHQWLSRLHDRGDLHCWLTALHQWDASGSLTARSLPPDQQGYIAVEGMSTIAHSLAEGLTIWRNRQVVAMAWENSVWRITLASGRYPSDLPLSLIAKALLLAIPAPQAYDLISPLIAEGLVPEDLAVLAQVTYQPCLTTIVGYPNLAAEMSLPWRTVAFSDHADLALTLWDSSKRSQTSATLLVLHSTPTFAAAHLEAADLQLPGRLLIQAAAQTLGSWINDPAWVQVHRWRYARPDQTLAVPYLASTAPGLLVCGGDWCGGQGVESALASGFAAAGWVNQQLARRSLLSDSELIGKC